MGEDDLVLPIHGVLGALMARGKRPFLGFQQRAVWRVQADRAQGTSGNVDVVDVVENYRMACAGHSGVILFRGGQSLASMAQDLLHQAGLR